MVIVFNANSIFFIGFCWEYVELLEDLYFYHIFAVFINVRVKISVRCLFKSPHSLRVLDTLSMYVLNMFLKCLFSNVSHIVSRRPLTGVKQ